MTEPLDAGWYDWVTSNLGRDPARAAAATRAAAQAVSEGRGFNAAAGAARASWDAYRLAPAPPVALVDRPDPHGVPGSLVAGTALAVGGALASIALILWMIQPTAPCTDLCPSFRNLAYLFLAGNVAVAGLHAGLFVLMWRRRATSAWWMSIVVVAGILFFDAIGELTFVIEQFNPNGQPILGGYATLAGLVPTAIMFWDPLHLGRAWDVIASHWLLLHLLLVELPIFFLLSTRAARAWCRVTAIRTT